MKIGHFGKISFSVSEKKVYSFTNFNKTVSARWVEHVKYKSKPVSEFLGRNLDTITLSIVLLSSMGVKPRKEIKRWEHLVRYGKHDFLVIGGKQVGRGEWKVISVAESWEDFFIDGSLIGATIEVSFTEY